jgi:protein-disulfide isomerase
MSSGHDSHGSADSGPKGMSTGGAIIGMLIAGILGFVLRGVVTPSGGGSGADVDIAVVPAGAVDPSVERFKVELGHAPVKGDAKAKVTIVEFSDFQCPFCSRASATVAQIEKTYGKDVRVAFKHNPLPFHPNAMPSAEAAMAANEQGKFWEMHDKLFGNQQAQQPTDFEKYAGEIGVDVGKMKASIAAGKNKQQIQADMAEAAKVGARGTPYFFINGRPLSGAQPFDAFKKVIDEEITAANKAIKAGVPSDKVYAALIKNGKEGTGDAQAPGAAAQPTAQRPSPPPQDNQVYKVPVGNSPQKGPSTAMVTIVEFSDFQCPFCSRVEGTLDQVEKEYGNKVRIVWKNAPLPFHDKAMPAAIAAMSVGEQGKFWEMHDTLFKNQQALDGQALEKYATDLHVDMGKFKKGLESEKIKKEIAEDQALAAQLGARGTPSFFINGKSLRGAQPFPAFKSAIDAALTDAEAALKRGVKPANLYAELTKNGLEKVAAAAPQPGAQQPGQAPPSDTTVYKALVEDAPVKGNKNAKVTIVEFSDFQCPFCGRVEPTVDQVMKAYPNDVRVAFKQLPLPFHNNAHTAAEAALAAKAQGKFWEMHGIMFKNQQALDRPSLEKYAGEIGLDVGKFKADLDSGKWKAKVDAELAEGNKIGARGTPSFFVNGKTFVGAQPFDAFKAKIDEEIKNADAVSKAKHVTGAKIYDELMKDAKAEVAAAAAPAAGGGDDANTVYKVDAGNGPSTGPAGAPVQIVLFSDFQCPFCSKVEPTVKQILDTYKGKVRLTWRNYPLPFHNNAMPAAEAAMAAGEQGKFWEMHDKLFANQQALDRASFEKYAGELGLDMNRFKAALDGGKMKEKIQADVTYANGLPGGGMGTPTFFINGHKLAGAYPFDSFKSIIDAELKKKG